jgi:hypothetical protein
MKREKFVKIVEESLDSLPQEFRSRDVKPDNILLAGSPQERVALTSLDDGEHL